MAHRQTSLNLVVLSGWSPSVGLAGASRGLESGCAMKHVTLLRAVRFRFRRIVMRGFNRTVTMVCTSLILESTLSG